MQTTLNFTKEQLVQQFMSGVQGNSNLIKNMTIEARIVDSDTFVPIEELSIKLDVSTPNIQLVNTQKKLISILIVMYIVVEDYTSVPKGI